MWFFQVARNYAGWAISIAKKITRVAPMQIFMVVVGTLVSQLSLMLAFFLPLKIIILIGSDRVPSYFPAAFVGMQRETLVVGLSIAALAFYALHLLAGQLATVGSERAATRVLGRAGKLNLFNNQDNMARGACRKFARAIAAAIFVCAALLIIGLIHPSIAVLLVGWCVVSFLAVTVAGALSRDFRTWIDDHASPLIGALAASGFFAVTALIVIEFLLGSRINILAAFICLLLSRQLLQRLAATLREAKVLHSQKMQINALFFHGHTFVAGLLKEKDGVWSLLGEKRLRKWLPATIAEITGQDIQSATITQWRQTGVFDVIAFDVRTTGPHGGEGGYLFKIVGRKRRLHALHEADLLADGASHALPAPRLLGVSALGQHMVHVFEKIDGVPTEPRSGTRAALKECWLNPPSRELTLRFRRTHQLLGQRMTTLAVDRLEHAAVTPRDQLLVRKFIRQSQALARVLNQMPLAVYNPDMGRSTLVECRDGSILVTHWGRWSLEPVGAGWSVGKPMLEMLGSWLEAERKNDPRLASLTVEQVQLAALAFAFERFCLRQRYTFAIRLLPPLLARLRAASPRPARRVPVAANGGEMRMTGT